MKHLTLSVVLLVLVGVIAESQSPETKKLQLYSSEQYENECGSQASESMAWSSVDGRVTRIISGNSIMMLMANREQKLVSLAAVDVPSNRKAARALLTRLVLNRGVRVFVNPSYAAPKDVTGVVLSDTSRDVNQALIEAGVARYRVPGPYVMSNYRACVYRIVERKARDAKLGIWKTADR